jgi:hypothetical protein
MLWTAAGLRRKLLKAQAEADDIEEVWRDLKSTKNATVVRWTGSESRLRCLNLKFAA